MGLVTPLVHIANSVRRSYLSLDVAIFISPDAVCCGPRCSHAVVLYYDMLSWWDGFHNDESLVFICCMVLEIQLFFLIPSSKASCFVEASDLVDDVL